MNRRSNLAMMLTVALSATAALAPAAHAGNVAWGVSVGGPGWGIAAGQPAFRGGRVVFRAPLVPVAVPYWRPIFRPVVRRPIVVVPAPVFIAPPLASPFFAPGSY